MNQDLRDILIRSEDLDFDFLILPVDEVHHLGRNKGIDDGIEGGGDDFIVVLSIPFRIGRMGDDGKYDIKQDDAHIDENQVFADTRRFFLGEIGRDDIRAARTASDSHGKPGGKSGRDAAEEGPGQHIGVKIESLCNHLVRDDADEERAEADVQRSEDGELLADFPEGKEEKRDVDGKIKQG